MAWLVRDGKVLATLEVETSRRGRARGLLGRDGIDGAMLLRPARSVHTFRMRFSIDVAFCDDDLRVLKVTTLHRNRMTRPVLRARSVIECEAGMLHKWAIRPGVRLEVRGLDDAVGPRRRAADRILRRRRPPGPAQRSNARSVTTGGVRPTVLPAPPAARAVLPAPTAARAGVACGQTTTGPTGG